MPSNVGEFALRILIGFIVGGLIGIERERARVTTKSGKDELPGLRTFGLTSIYGSMTGYLSYLETEPQSTVILLLSTIGMLLIVFFYAFHRMIIKKLSGVTTMATMLLTYFLGILAGYGFLVESVSTSILVTFILSIKYPSARLAKELSYREFIAILEVGTLSLTIGPIIYSLNLSFLGVDLFKVYLFFLIVLIVSLTSYFLVRLMGTKGIEASSVLGSLVNSEATIGSVTSLLLSWPRQRALSTMRRVTILILSTLQIRAVALALVALYMFLGVKETIQVAPPLLIALLPGLIVALIELTRLEKASAEGEAQMILASPLNWATAARIAVAYTLLTITVYVVSNTVAEIIPLIAI
ncbi:MAG: MgtC/SapB family protein, partial [Desulfurococcales archaeon]|nr:MgtC/SapB family protein [Desulfurococcales archaeon]